MKEFTEYMVYAVYGMLTLIYFRLDGILDTLKNIDKNLQKRTTNNATMDTNEQRF
jgi:hypothetical protein